MGRELKRVPLDFDWPPGQIWKGYLNPHWQYRRECEMCEGTGYSPQAKKLSEQWYGKAPFEPAMTGSEPFTPETPEILQFATRNVERDPEFYTAGFTALAGKGVRVVAVLAEAARLASLFNGQWCHHLDQDDVQALVDAGRLMDFTHTWSEKNRWQRRTDNYVPTAREVNLWSLFGLGHDGINNWVCVKAKCKRLGVSPTCPCCDGDGDQWPSEETKAAYKAWEQQEPPTGDGFQLWETTSEGSPVSPVFTSLEELCAWCADNATTFGSEKATKEEWLQMLGDGLVYHQAGNITFI